MGKGAPLRWCEDWILRRHIHGRGIEIGALWRRFRVRNDVLVWYVDRLSPEGLREDYPEFRDIVRPDVVADAADLPFPPGGLDFIIAGHVLEHLPLPMKALRRWHDALGAGGTLLVRVPDKRFTFDSVRKRTTLEHLIHEEAHPDEAEARSHYADWVEHISHAKPADGHFESAVQELIDSGFSIHYHVWTDEDVQAMIDYTTREWKLTWRPVLFWRAHFYRKETIILMRKGSR